MNPPYKKIATKSEHRKALREIPLETVNLYTGFVGLSIQKLKRGGELVAIIPRSFCIWSLLSAFQRIHVSRDSNQAHPFVRKQESCFFR